MAILLLAKTEPEDTTHSFGHVSSENISQIIEPMTLKDNLNSQFFI